MNKVLLGISFSLLSIGLCFANEIQTTINGPIEEGSLAAQIAIINSARVGDTVVIYAHSGGGLVYEGNKLIDAIRTTKASKVTMVVAEECDSMCNYIAAKTSEIDVGSNSVWVFHLGQMHFSDSNVVVISVDSNVASIKQEALETYALIKKDWGNMLTDEEYSQILHGHDVELSGIVMYSRASLSGYNGPVIKLFTL